MRNSYKKATTEAGYELCHDIMKWDPISHRHERRTGRPHAWWRHQMETFCALLAIYAGNSPVTDEFPVQRPVTRSFDGFFDLRLNKHLSKQ